MKEYNVYTEPLYNDYGYPTKFRFKTVIKARNSQSALVEAKQAFPNVHIMGWEVDNFMFNLIKYKIEHKSKVIDEFLIDNFFRDCLLSKLSDVDAFVVVEKDDCHCVRREYFVEKE